MRQTVIAALVFASFGTLAAAQTSAPTAAIDPSAVAITQPVKGSDIPVRLMYVPMYDGVYSPIGLRTPAGPGPFPIVVFASGNGGGGMPVIIEETQNQSWTQEQFLKAGYAVAWMRYRAEIELGYNKFGKMLSGNRQGRQLLNRAPLDYEDVIAIIKFVKTLPYIDANRVGYMGMSHGGEMAFKITSEYHDLKAAVASEPANHEFLSLTPDNTATVTKATGMRDIESMLMRETDKARGRIDLKLSQERIATITTPIFVQGRDTDELQGIFRVGYDLLAEAKKDAIWKTYDHAVHGFVYVKRDKAGVYAPDPIQLTAVKDSIEFFDKYMKAGK
ncbi:MAG: dienelactone hydrolase family protein [Acidobacteriota bacterium]